MLIKIWEKKTRFKTQNAITTNCALMIYNILQFVTNAIQKRDLI